MTGIHVRLRLLAILAWIPVVFSGSLLADDEGVRDIGSRLEPFVDEYLIESMSGVQLRLHPPVRREVVFRFDAPWEGGQSAYVTLMHDQHDYRLYYRGGGDLVREYTCMAVSQDGIHWERPHLGLFECEGSKQNNIIWTGEKKAYWESHNFSPFKDTNPAAPASERYKAVTLSRRVIGNETEARRILMAFVSPDGVVWRRLQEEPIITEGGFDSHNVAFWDARRQSYVCYLRCSSRGKRSVSQSTSKDFRHWSKPEPLDFGDTPPEHFYTNGIIPYFRAPHVYLGFPMRFIPPSERNTAGFEQRKTDGLSDAVFITSRDGQRWDRRFMEAFVRPGPDSKNWGGAHGNNTPAWGIAQTGETEISVYWSEHYDNYPSDKLIPQLRRGTVRLDGFVSVNAPYEGGEFTTKPIRFKGNALGINYSTSAVGSVKIEIQDAQGDVISGFGLSDAMEIWGDEVDRVVAWKSGSGLRALAGRPVRLRFVMKDADLYSLQFRP